MPLSFVFGLFSGNDLFVKALAVVKAILLFAKYVILETFMGENSAARKPLLLVTKSQVCFLRNKSVFFFFTKIKEKMFRGVKFCLENRKPDRQMNQHFVVIL